MTVFQWPTHTSTVSETLGWDSATPRSAVPAGSTANMFCEKTWLEGKTGPYFPWPLVCITSIVGFFTRGSTNCQQAIFLTQEKPVSSLPSAIRGTVSEMCVPGPESTEDSSASKVNYFGLRFSCNSKCLPPLCPLRGGGVFLKLPSVLTCKPLISFDLSEPSVL